MTLDEIIERVRQIGEYVLFHLKQTPITPFAILKFIIVFGVFYFLARLIDRSLTRRILPRFQIDSGLQYALARITRYSLIIIGALVAFQVVGIDLSGVAVIFGLLSVGIGFGLQNVTANFVSGLILLFERPIRIGDRVTVGDTEGDVTAINMRATTIRSLDNISIIVPNQTFISSNVINWSHGDPKIRLGIHVGVSYDSDLDLVLATLREVAVEHPEVLAEPPPNVMLTEFGDSSWNMLLRCWISEPKRHHLIRSDINCAIVRKFREHNIEIPYPQRDLHLRSPLPLSLAVEKPTVSA